MKRLSQIITGHVDWEYLINLAEYHNVTPLIAYNLTQNELADKIPDFYSERLHKIYIDNVYRNVFLSNELVKILAIFSQNDIDVITLKGSILGEQLYVNPGLRTTNDIDILVQPEKIPQASTLLEGMGYAESTLPEEIEHSFHKVYYKKAKFQFMVELHWDLNDPKLEIVNREEIWNRAKPYQFQGCSTTVLSPEDTLVLISTRILTHDGEHLKHLADITELLEKNRDDLEWDYIIKTGHSLGITPTIYFALRWSHNLLRAPVPKAVMKSLRPSLTRRFFINWLISYPILISMAIWSRLKSKISILARSLMISRKHQAYMLLSKYWSYDQKALWIRTIAWMPLVLGAALFYNTSRFFGRRKL